MAAITAAMVKALREKTDAPMMECKKALTEADGDAAKAEEILRVKLGNKASKAASRVTAEGVIGTYVSPDGKTGAIVEVNSETDFVAKNPEFLKMAADAAKLIAEKAPADVAALSALELEGKTLDAIRTALVGKIGENMTFRRFKRLEAKGKLHKYVHGGSKIATLVDVEGGDDEVAHDIAMHIAASKPKALNAEGIDPALIETERRVAIEKAKEAGKPEAMLERIADGTVKKFLKEVTLLDQPFVKDDKVTIAQLLKSKNANVADFALFVVGEGLEKRNDDFAAEVAAQTAAAQKA
ncbi:translation elongation factor Ts [Duodenibacillus massiliensis]|jgi:translation elongation factor Ts|uniref:translation elongation factor Ts n=3 Tax=Duodenibacillus massiliensis TaxID=1852381 RepID=UPI00033C3C90|nr:translation elongation factor Ts [Duodenibacillus massiliensis]MBE5701082.1 elongation factor Ts [Sutterella sp.]MBS1386427.1 elongation factor Ts [Duodenibacillus sp.]MBS5792342.1 elongation factor Ts [Sutterella sp.]CDD70603.1 elongation factor Ts [Sutterella sp. CAG:397]